MLFTFEDLVNNVNGFRNMIVIHGILIGILITVAFLNIFIYLGRKNDKSYLSFAICYFSFAVLLFIRWIYFHSLFFNENLYFVLFTLTSYFLAGSILYMMITFFKIENAKIILLYISFYIILGIGLSVTYFLYFLRNINLMFQLFVIPISAYALSGLFIPILEIFIKKRFMGKSYYFLFFSQLILLLRLFMEPIFMHQSNGFLTTANFLFIFSGSFLFTYAIVDHFNQQNRTLVGSHDLQTDCFISRFGITGREKEIISLLRKGSSYQEIAKRLFISMKTVESHIYHIYKKTGSKNKIQLLTKISKNA